MSDLNRPLLAWHIAEILDIPEEEVVLLCENGELPSTKVFSYYMVWEADLQKWMAKTGADKPKHRGKPEAGDCFDRQT